MPLLSMFSSFFDDDGNFSLQATTAFRTSAGQRTRQTAFQGSLMSWQSLVNMVGEETMMNAINEINARYQFAVSRVRSFGNAITKIRRGGYITADTQEYLASGVATQTLLQRVLNSVNDDTANAGGSAASANNGQNATSTGRSGQSSTANANNNTQSGTASGAQNNNNTNDSQNVDPNASQTNDQTGSGTDQAGGDGTDAAMPPDDDSDDEVDNNNVQPPGNNDDAESRVNFSDVSSEEEVDDGMGRTDFVGNQNQGRTNINNANTNAGGGNNNNNNNNRNNNNNSGSGNGWNNSSWNQTPQGAFDIRKALGFDTFDQVSLSGFEGTKIDPLGISALMSSHEGQVYTDHKEYTFTNSFMSSCCRLTWDFLSKKDQHGRTKAECFLSEPQITLVKSIGIANFALCVLNLSWEGLMNAEEKVDTSKWKNYTGWCDSTICSDFIKNLGQTKCVDKQFSSYHYLSQYKQKELRCFDDVIIRKARFNTSIQSSNADVSFDEPLHKVIGHLLVRRSELISNSSIPQETNFKQFPQNEVEMSKIADAIKMSYGTQYHNTKHRWYTFHNNICRSVSIENLFRVCDAVMDAMPMIEKQSTVETKIAQLLAAIGNSLLLVPEITQNQKKKGNFEGGNNDNSNGGGDNNGGNNNYWNSGKGGKNKNKGKNNQWNNGKGNGNGGNWNNGNGGNGNGGNWNNGNGGNGWNSGGNNWNNGKNNGKSDGNKGKGKNTSPYCSQMHNFIGQLSGPNKTKVTSKMRCWRPNCYFQQSNSCFYNHEDNNCKITLNMSEDEQKQALQELCNAESLAFKWE